MTLTALLRRAATSAGLLATALLLSGCMLTSETLLVDTAEAVDVLGGSFTMVGYNDNNGDGTYEASDDAPVQYTLKDGGYVDPEGRMTVYMLPRNNDEYLLAIAGPDSILYGLATVRDGIMTLRVIFEGNPNEEAATFDTPLPAGVTFESGGVTVSDRASLDAVLAHIADGSFATSPLVAWVGSGTPPAAIVTEGDWYRAQD